MSEWKTEGGYPQEIWSHDPERGRAFVAKTYKLEHAHLIAAAPDLLAACEQVLPSLFDGDPRRQAEDDACIMLRAAIAKAKGEL